MKRIVTILTTVVMLISSLSFGTSVFAAAKEVPELKLGETIQVTAPKGGNTDNPAVVATFVPEKTGAYVFSCDKTFDVSSAKKGEVASGAFDIEGTTQEESVQGTAIVISTKISDAEKALLKQMGMNMDTIGTVKAVAPLLTAGHTYEIKLSQDGAEDYTANLTVKEHTHKMKEYTETVKVNKNGTSDSSGGIFMRCEDPYCPYEETKTMFYEIQECKVKNAVYTGKKVKPAVSFHIYDESKLAKKYYTVTYKNNKNVGTGQAIIKFQNGYKGTVTKNFKINPKATKVTKTSSGKQKLKVTWKKVAGVTGYQVQAATDKKFTKNKTSVTVQGEKTTSTALTKLKSGKSYYVRVRAVQKVKGKTYYSAWTKAAVKKVK